MTDELSRNERIKEASDYLRGTLADGLREEITGAIIEDDAQLVKFHGMYLQDDRDLRPERARKKMEKAFSFMIRVRIPGGVLSPRQWLALDEVARVYGNGTMRLTTRQTVQLHGVIKSNLKATLKAIDKVLLNSIAACGDINRNVMCNVLPEQSRAHAAAIEMTRAISDHLLPQTPAYREIWLDGERIAGGEEEVAEPIYGKTYLPRKFKIVVAVPPSNDVDIFAHDLGYIAILDNAATSRLECHGRWRHGNDPWRARYLSAHRRRHGFLPDRGCRRRSPRLSSPCSATGATARTASTRGLSTQSRIAVSTLFAPRSSAAPVLNSRPPKPLHLHVDRRPIRLDRG